MFARYFRGMMAEGISLPPSQFEGLFLSTEHSEEDIDKTIEAADRVFASLAANKEHGEDS
jgi:glutamate-1-semialdehyde 2,1-aminomutase